MATFHNRASHKLLTILISLAAVIGAVLMLANYSPSVSAQSCPTVDVNKGRVEYNFSVQEAGVYRVWTRMQAGNSYNNSVYLRVDSDCAINIGDKSVPSDSWKWVDYKDGNTGSKVNVSLGSGNHVLRYFGKEKNVKVDTVVLLKDSNCTPQGEDGKNCQIIPATTPTEDSSSSSDSSASTTQTTKPDKPIKIGSVIINEEGEQFEVEGEDEGGSFYTDDETGEKVYAQEELTESEAEEIGYIAKSNSRLPWLIALGVLVVSSVAVFAYTIIKPEQAHHIVAYQHKALDSIKRLFNKNHKSSGPPPPTPPGAAGGSAAGSNSTIVYPSN